MLRVFYTVVLLASVGHTRAQSFDEKDFIQYTVKDGLSNNNISGLQQDASGYMWIGTFHGLNRFDGSIFKQFLQSSQHNSIPDNGIISMRLLPDSSLALATDDGAQIISTKTLTAKNLNVPTEDVLRYWSNSCQSVYEDGNGNYGISTKTGFYIFSSAGQLKKRFDYYSVKDIGHTWMNFGSTIYQLPDGNMMMANDFGLLLYDRRRNSITNLLATYSGFTQLPEQKNYHPRFFFISAFKILLCNKRTNCFDIIDIRDGKTRSFSAAFNIEEEIGWQTKLNRADDSTWLITSKNKGFYLLRIDTLTQTIFSYSEKYFTNYLCKSVFFDRQKRLWIGTSQGLFMKDLHPKLIRTFAMDEKKNNAFAITCLYILPNKIFAGTDKKQIIVWDRLTHKIIRTIQLDTLPRTRNIVTSFEQLNADTLWIGTTSGLFWMDIQNLSTGAIAFENFFKKSEIELLFKDRMNNIWFGLNSINNIIYYNYAGKKFKTITNEKYPLLKINIVTSFAEDQEGRIWIGGDAIARWNPYLQNIDTLIERLPTQRNHKKGYSVMNDSKKTIWTTINDDGIATIGKFAKPVHLRPDNFLRDYSSQSFASLLQDKIFLPIDNGIGFLDLTNLQAVAIDHADGVPLQPVTSFYFSYDSSDQSVWFACGSSICKIPFLHTNVYRQPPFLNVTEISIIDDSTINYPSAITRLKHFQNNIRILFSAVNFTDPQNMRFAYRIKNKKDSNWINIGSQQNIFLTNISPGDYDLEIKAHAYDNKWPDQIIPIKIIIEPPFWQAIWFILLVVGLALAGIFILYRYRIRSIHQKANIDKQLAELEIKGLHSQMNPHFIFNSLNSIKEMILENEKLNASRYLSKFAQLIRTNLEQSRQTFITVKQCIDHLRQYLEMEKIRFDDFSYCIEVDEGLATNEIYIVPMLLQPLVENAIWHGLHKKPGEKKLSIFFLKSKDEIVCKIQDNGIGINQSLKNKQNSQSAHRSFGIANIHERLSILNEKYRINCSLKVMDRSEMEEENGTLAILRLNLNKNA